MTRNTRASLTDNEWRAFHEELKKHLESGGTITALCEQKNIAPSVMAYKFQGLGLPPLGKLTNRRGKRTHTNGHSNAKFVEFAAVGSQDIKITFPSGALVSIPKGTDAAMLEAIFKMIGGKS